MPEDVLYIDHGDSTQEGPYYKSKLGGAIRVYGQELLLTAAHPFIRSQSHEHGTSAHFISDETSHDDPQQTSNTQATNYEYVTEELVHIGDLCDYALDAARPELDYALIMMRDGVKYGPTQTADPTLSTSYQFPDFTKETEFASLGITPIRLCTDGLGGDSSSVSGHLDPTPVYLRLPGQNIFQKVFTIDFNHTVSQGDCGTWVMDSEERKLHGHIVAGCPGDSIGYIIPAYEVFGDIRIIFATSEPPSSEVSEEDVVEPTSPVPSANSSGVAPLVTQQQEWADSFGGYVGFIDERHWWHATGSALEAFSSRREALFPELQDALTDVYTSTLYFSLYMIGSTKSKARPVIMLFCDEKTTRKHVKKTLRRSGILKELGLKGFKVGHSARQPGHDLLLP